MPDNHNNSLLVFIEVGSYSQGHKQFSQRTPAQKCAAVTTEINVRGGASQHGKNISAPFSVRVDRQGKPT